MYPGAMTTNTVYTTSQHGTDGLRVVIAATPAAEAAAIAFLRRHTAWDLGQKDYRVISDVQIDSEDTGDALMDYLFPTCEHGLSAHLCAGPEHYPTHL